MRAFYFDGELRYEPHFPEPVPSEAEALIRTHLCGICTTDREIVRGYLGFHGIPGHEFVGTVERADSAPHLVGKRVVGEINAYCGYCPVCLSGNVTHCPERTTLGIVGRNGAMADYFTLPVKLLHHVPHSVPDTEAVFTEPLAAACQITEQIHIRATHRVIIIGDGKLGLLIAQVLRLTGCELIVVGRHKKKLALLDGWGIAAKLPEENIAPGADIVIEATGNPEGFEKARTLVRPRGIIIVKSTFHSSTPINMTMIVVDEVTIMGSRCGPFAPALRLLKDNLVHTEPLIDMTFPLDQARSAFERAHQKGVLKILLDAQR